MEPEKSKNYLCFRLGIGLTTRDSVPEPLLRGRLLFDRRGVHCWPLAREDAFRLVVGEVACARGDNQEVDERYAEQQS